MSLSDSLSPGNYMSPAVTLVTSQSCHLLPLTPTLESSRERGTLSLTHNRQRALWAPETCAFQLSFPLFIILCLSRIHTLTVVLNSPFSWDWLHLWARSSSVCLTWRRTVTTLFPILAETCSPIYIFICSGKFILFHIHKHFMNFMTHHCLLILDCLPLKASTPLLLSCGWLHVF